MSSADIITLLEKQGCENLTSRLNFQAYSEYPVSTGGYGDVYSGRLVDDTPVAIKIIRPHDSDGLSAGKYQKRAAKELYAWSKCNHPNVLRLLGLAEFRNRLAMISLWAENGTLPSYIRKNPLVNRCSLSTSVSEGLAYLHVNGIIHGDLKGANILVSSDGVPMLTDFGNAKLAEATLAFTTTAAVSFSPRWTAPEILEGSTSHSRAGDVYALGMAILEIISGEVPFSRVGEMQIPTMVLVKKATPPRPEKQIPTRSVCGDILWALLMKCWAREPKLRPSSAQVRDIMSDITQDSLAYIEAGPDDEP